MFVAGLQELPSTTGCSFSGGGDGLCMVNASAVCVGLLILSPKGAVCWQVSGSLNVPALACCARQLANSTKRVVLLMQHPPFSGVLRPHASADRLMKAYFCVYMSMLV